MKEETDERQPTLMAGAATVDISPAGSVFLYGYPKVLRYSTGVHDPLECAALFLRSGTDCALFLANDVIFVTKKLAAEIRRTIAARTGVPEEAIMVTATHTHSGPVTADMLSNAADPVVPKVDPQYLARFAEGVVSAAETAVRGAVSAEMGLRVAHAEGVGSNRHDPAGPTDPEVPVLAVRSRETKQMFACMLVYGMHPTVLHEDSTLISGDFPAFTRRALRREVLAPSCTILYHCGAAGNQSPRNVVCANTFEEAKRLGTSLARAVAEELKHVSFGSDFVLDCRRTFIKVEPRRLATPLQALQFEREVRSRFEQLKSEEAPRALIRTAECDLFGAEEATELARATTDGRLASAIAACTPAEIQVVAVGPWKFVAWPGEFFVEHGLDLKRHAAPGTFLITLANGELQGYIATPEAETNGFYEASNAIFAASNGKRFVETTLELLNNWP